MNLVFMKSSNQSVYGRRIL